MPSTAPQFRPRLKAGHEAFRRRRFLEAFFLGASLVLPVTVAALGLGIVLRRSPLGGWLVPLLTAAALALALVRAARFGRRHHLSYPEFLRHLERRLGLSTNELVNADELEEALPRLSDPLSAGLAGLTVETGSRKLDAIDFGRLAPELSLRRPLALMGASALLLAVLGLLSPGGLASSVSRLWRPGSFDLAPALLVLVEPGNATVERGASVQVRARFPERAEGARLLYRSPAGAWKDLAMRADSAGSGWACAAVIPQILETTEYAVASSKAQSETYKLSVVEALRATGYRTRITFPEYTGLAPVQELRVDGNLAAPLGSRIALTVFPSRSQARGRLLRADGTAVALENAGQGELSADLAVRGPWEYRVELSAPETPGSRWISESFRIEVLPDRPPTLVQLAPDKSIKLPPDQQVRLDIDCLDDFGLTRLDLVYHRNDQAPQKVNISHWQGARDARVQYPWILSDLALLPGDRVTYHLELFDNDAVSGPKATIGPDYEIRFPSFDEMYAGVKEERDQQMGDVTETLEEQKQISQDLHKIQDELKQGQAMRWEQKEQVKDLVARQEKIAQQVQNLSQSLDSSLDHMQQANLFTPEMLEKVQQINQLVSQIQSPEFQEYMKKLQEAMEKLDRAAVNQAMENLKLNQQELERNLDRTLEMLKQLQREEKLDALLQQAERLQDQEKRLNDQVCDKKPNEAGQEKKDQGNPPEKKPGQQNPQDQQGGQQKPQDSGAECSPQPMNKEEAAAASKKQEELRAELEKLQKEFEKLGQEAEQQWKALAQELKNRQPEPQLSAASKDMKSASQSMGQCQRQQSVRFGRQAEKELKSFTEQMRQAQQAMRGGDQEEIARKLYALSNALVRLSQEQEGLCDAAPARSTRDLAVDEQGLQEGARKVLDQLYELGRRSRFITPELGRVMGEAVRRLGGSSQEFGQGERALGMVEGRASSEAMDATVLALLNANQQMCNSSCNGGNPNPIARLRSLSGQQESLNQDMSQMMGKMGGGQRLLGSSGSAGEQMMQMAARQEAIRQGLAEVQQSMGSQAGVLGRLGDIGQEMADVVQQMQKHEVDPRILERQEHILSRLLTAQRSLRKEGQKEERVSRTGVNPDNLTSPPPVSEAETPQDALRRAVLRGSQDPVPTDFRRLVEIYFRSLGESK